MARYKNAKWVLPGTDAPDFRLDWESVKAALLMDIRDELQTLNRLLACDNFTGIPATLAAIKRNTTKRKPKRKGSKR